MSKRRSRSEGRREMKTRRRRRGSRRTSSAADAEVADEVGGDRPDRAAEVPDGAERPLGGDAGDGRDQGRRGSRGGRTTSWRRGPCRRMLRALGPLASAEGVETSPVRQIAVLEAKVKELERAGRRSQRLLLMTRRVIESREKRISSTKAGKSPSRSSKAKASSAQPASSPTPGWRGRALDLGA